MSYTRYAVFYTPPAGALAEFGATWLGWDIASGRPRPHPVVTGLPLSVAKITATPRRYGFHATLKAPFRLAEGTTEERLDEALALLCRRLGPAAVVAPAPAALADFLAIRAGGDTGTVDALAARLVEGLEAFRAPMAPGEIDRHVQGLTPRQAENLTRWGYPHVMQDFRFHMTLTGRLADTEAEAVLHALRPRLAPLLPPVLRIEDVTLAGEDPNGNFHALRRFALRG